jgi:hypothetical protein
MLLNSILLNPTDVEEMLLNTTYYSTAVCYEAAWSAGVDDALASSNGDRFVEETALRIAAKIASQPR